MEQVHTGIPRKFSGRFYGTGKSRHTVKQTNRWILIFSACIHAIFERNYIYSITFLPQISKEMNMPLKKVIQVLRISQKTQSIDSTIGQEDDTELEEIIADKKTQSPEEIVTTSMLSEQIEEVLETLSDREKGILSLRYGLKDGEKKTLEEVGKAFNVTRERARQIENRALRKLAHPSRANKLIDYYYDIC